VSKKGALFLLNLGIAVVTLLLKVSWRCGPALNGWPFGAQGDAAERLGVMTKIKRENSERASTVETRDGRSLARQICA
jgi:hypothetical protein